MHNLSFTTHDLQSSETFDETNPCIWILAQSGYNATNSLIFGHLARRNIIDGLKEYPKEAIQCHEEFIRGVGRKMKAAIEIVYGQSV